MTAPKVVFGVFAHNEAARIPAFLTSLMAQDVFQHDAWDAELLILSNGSTDATVSIARAHPIAATLGDRYRVIDYDAGGKSRTWNKFVTLPETAHAEILGFLDADIRFERPDVLRNLCSELSKAPDIHAFVSQPIAVVTELKGPFGKLMKAGAGTADDWKNAICGQLYTLRGPVARRMRLPIGLPVEDGFVAPCSTQTSFRTPPGRKRAGSTART